MTEKPLDWIDIGLHVLGALFIMWAIGTLGQMPVVAVIVNTLFWPFAWEWPQHRNDPMVLLRRPQPFMEWVLPVATGIGWTLA